MDVNTTFNQSLFTIPVGFRPNRTTMHICYNDGQFIRIDIDANGQGILRNTGPSSTLKTTSWLNLNGCSYLIDSSPV